MPLLCFFVLFVVVVFVVVSLLACFFVLGDCFFSLTVLKFLGRCIVNLFQV